VIGAALNLRTTKSDGMWDVRMEIATVLGALGTADAVDVLIDTLNNDFDDDVRLQACRALGQIRAPRAAEALAACLAVTEDLDLGDWDTGDDIGLSVVWDLQREALEGLARIGGEEAVEAAIRLLNTDDDDGLQGLGLRVLATIGGQRATDFVIAQLKTGQRTARRQAAKALSFAQMPDDTAIPPLLAALEDSDSDVRMAAGWGLVSKAAPSTFPALIQLLQDPDASVRGEAIMMVTDLADTEIGTPLIRLAYDPERAVQLRAIQALGERREPRASANLLALLTRSQGDDGLANTLIVALGQLQAREALEPLGQLLKSGCLPPTTRLQAVLALGEIAAAVAGSTTSEQQPETSGLEPAEVDPIDILSGLVDDDDLQVGQAALFALSRIGGEQAHATLMRVLRGDMPEPACDAGDTEPAVMFPTSTLEAIQAASAAETKPDGDPLDRRNRLRCDAARIIRDLDFPQAQPLLHRLARDSAPQLRCEALLALDRDGDGDAVMAIIAQGIGGVSREVRLAALQALSQLQPDHVTPLLLEQLAVEPDPLVKQRLIETTGRLGDGRATACLMATLDDDDRHVQRAALKALAGLADRFAIAAVRPFLFAHGGALWQDALTMLQDLKDPEIEAFLLDSLTKPEQEEYHWIAIAALAAM
ncbi:HEAT repeat domain-containing protein, partial [Candidatus Entotheonella palauensis]|uniref:HEAT repeat domain-containing protein n=1 Tax=Candidatus Entotheonella palauensis TaxID=93172 RepID=UPI00117819CB